MIKAKFNIKLETIYITFLLKIILILNNKYNINIGNL